MHWNKHTRETFRHMTSLNAECEHRSYYTSPDVRLQHFDVCEPLRMFRAGVRKQWRSLDVCRPQRLSCWLYMTDLAKPSSCKRHEWSFFFFFRSGHDVSMWHIGGMLGKLKHLSTFTFFTKRIQSYPGNKCIKKTIDGLSSTKWQSLNQGSSSAVQRRNTAALPGCCVSFF